MTRPPFLRRRSTWLIGGPIVLVLLVAVVAPFVYINLIRADPPDRLDIDDVAPAAEAPDDPTGADEVPASTRAPGDIEGTWTVADGSVAGYRVGEVLFGQDAEGVGRTSAVSGTMTIEATTVTTASFEVDMASVESDESRRDRQFHGRIMDTSTFGTATFVLTEPISLGATPADGVVKTVAATGEFTIRGETNVETIDLEVRIDAGMIGVAGALDIDFARYAIPDASGGPATVKDHGEIEVALRLV